MDFGSCHHLAVGADFGGGWLLTDGAGVQHGLVFLGHRSRGGFRLALLIEKAAIEGLLGTGRFRFEPVQHLLVEQRSGALRHRTFFDDVVDPVQDRVGGQFALG